MTSQQLQTRRTWSAGRIVLTAVGVVAMAAAVVLGWGVVYVLGAVALVVGVWPLARRVTPRIGPAVFVLIVLVAVGLPAYQAWRLYDGDARASLQVAAQPDGATCNLTAGRGSDSTRTPVDAVQLIDGGLTVTFDHDVMTVYGDPPDPRP